MDTLRGFVEAVLPEPRGNQAKFHSVPDRMSESFELRKLVAPQTRTRPITDFFEYYWAYQVRGTKYSHLVSWIKTLIFRRPSRVSHRLLPFWFVTWMLIIGLIVTSVRLAPLALGAADADPIRRVAIWLISAVLLPAVSAFALGYLGDAARYLSPVPENIATRHRIRADGVRLLRQLHRSGNYDRIVLVGHSLGSVIAYDILKHFWQEVNTCHAKPLQIDQSRLQSCDGAALLLESASKPVEALDEFRKCQRELWREQRSLGNPWLVTDLVTIGSPLTHAAMLLAHSPEELGDRQRERELPVAPPSRDHEGKFAYKVSYEVQGQKRTLRLLHHSALFACTRWTNIWCPGDFVGGPLAPLFGPGVKDELMQDGWISFTPASHTRYWLRPTADGQPQASLVTIRAAMDLDSKEWLR